ncbi:MAG: competence protein CoiA [Heyndrickxia sp.]
MLTAQSKDGTIYNLAGRKDLQYLQDLKKKVLFYCPICKEPVILKAGTQKIPHFSHRKTSNCTFTSEPESIQHMQGKADLYLWLLKQGFTVHLERYLPKIKQRPDILVNRNGQWFAIEYQCSPISLKTLIHRTNGYATHRIKSIWVLGGYPFHHSKGGYFQLSDFHWSFIKASETSGLILFSYTPQTQHFHLLSNISPYSSRKVQGTYSKTPLDNATFPILFSNSNQQKQQIDTFWFSQKRKWLQQKLIYGKAFQDPFLLSLYECTCHPLLLPPAIGLPVNYMGVCKTHPAVWQFYIWRDSIRSLKIGERVTFKHVINGVENRKKVHHIQFRELPFVHRSYRNRMIYLYLQMLVQLSYLKEVKKGTFELHKTITFPKNMEEVILYEKEFLQEFGDK